MNIKDFLHLYLGCQIMTPNGIGKLENIYGHSDECGVNFSEEEHWTYRFDITTVKPLLRPLSDMNEADAIEAEHLSLAYHEDRDIEEVMRPAQMTQFLLSKHFDLFNLIGDGLALDKTKEVAK